MEWMLMPLRRYADFSGRSRRKEFWMWTLLQLIVYVFVMLLIMAAGGGAVLSGDPTAIIAAGGAVLLIMGLYSLYALAVLIPSLAVAVRRLHDTDRSGWWILAPLVPYVLIIFAGTLVAMSQDMAGLGGILVMLATLALVALSVLLLVFYCLEGTKGANRYGPDPKEQAAEQVFA